MVTEMSILNLWKIFIVKVQLFGRKIWISDKLDINNIWVVYHGEIDILMHLARCLGVWILQEAFLYRSVVHVFKTMHILKN